MPPLCAFLRYLNLANRAPLPPLLTIHPPLPCLHALPLPSPLPPARQVALSGKCSALIKLAPDLSDLFMAHATWDTFTAMLRIYKHYHFNLTQLRPAAQRLSFSSYPGGRRVRGAGVGGVDCIVCCT